MPIDPIRGPRLLPLPSQGSITRPMFKTLGIAGSGLSVQRQRMDMIAQNISNADVTRGADNQPYKRRDIVLEAANSTNAMYGDNSAGSSVGAGVMRPSSVQSNMSSDSAKAIEVMVLPHGASPSLPSLPSAGPMNGEYGVRVSGVAEDQGEGRLVYEPGHPDANASGYVRYPDIDTTQELVRLMDAKRMYEANVSVFQTAKSMLRASLDI